MRQQRLRRLRRIVAGDDNPLRRYIDKLESAVIASLVISFLIAAPLLAVFAAREVGIAGAREERAQQAWRPVTAVLEQSASAGLIGLDGEWDTSWVRAKWTAPDGAYRSGLVAVVLNARAGQRLQVWVTPAGQLTHPRLTTAQVRERQVMAAIAAAAALALVLSIAGSIARVLANRRRIAAWGKAWEAAGPRWTSRR
jgi:hypothetical protein